MKTQRYLLYSGLIGVAVLWVSVLISLLITKFNVLGTLPISYLGTYESSRYIFNGGLLLTSLLLSFFVLQLRRYESLSKSFLSIFLFGQVCQAIVAITPYNATSIIRIIHIISAFALAFSLPVSMYFFKKSSVSLPIKNVTAIFLKTEIALFVLGIGWFVTASRAGALAEITTAIAFDVWIIWLSVKYSRQKNITSA